MNRLIAHLIKFKKSYIITTVVSLLVGVGIFLAYYFIQKQTLYGAMNGSGVAGAVLIGVGLLCMVARYGAFDTMSYGFKQLFASLVNREANKYNDMVEYKEEKNKVRESSSKYYLAIMLVSIIFFIVFIALTIYRYSVYK